MYRFLALNRFFHPDIPCASWPSFWKDDNFVVIMCMKERLSPQVCKWGKKQRRRSVHCFTVCSVRDQTLRIEETLSIEDKKCIVCMVVFLFLFIEQSNSIKL